MGKLKLDHNDGIVSSVTSPLHKLWIQQLFNWRVTFKEFLSEMTRDSNDNLRASMNDY